MSDDIEGDQVHVLGPRRGSLRGAPRGLLLLLVGLVSGLAVGFLLASGPTTPTSGGDLVAVTSTTELMTSPSTVASTSASTSGQPRPLRERVPGLSGTLLMAAYETPSQGFVLTWTDRLQYPHRSGDLPAESHPGFDASGSWVAALGPSSQASQGTLWVAATGNGLRPTVSGVLSFAMHAREPGRLVWIGRPLAGTETLTTAAIAMSTYPPLLDIELGASWEVESGWQVAWFDDWGIALTGWDPSGQLVLRTLDPEGLLLGEGPYEFVTASQDGQLLVRDHQTDPDDLFVVGATLEGPELLSDRIDIPAGIYRAVVSPDGRRLGFVTSDQFGWVELDGSTPPHLHPVDVPDVGIEPIQWSNNNRFLMVIQTDPMGADRVTHLSLLDTQDDSLDTVDIPGFVTDLVLVP